MTIERVIKKAQEINPELDTKIIERAYKFAEEAHRGQNRKSGEPYIEHPLHTAFNLIQIKADLSTIIAGILHDVPEDTNKTLEEIRKEFGDEVAELVEGITKLGKIKYRGITRYRENLRKMFLAMVDDIRIIYIKFCDRLHNLRTLDALPENKQQRIATETLEIYAPIAELIGIWHLKWQMEDICFKYLFPKEYKQIEYKYEIEKKSERNQFFQKVKNILEEELKKTKINYEISARFKHLYSIWKKMQIKERKFDEIYDVFALRVVVENIEDCYKVLGIIHNIWKPITDRFKDYIALPKPNGYRSLHTTIIGPDNKATEFQIKTKEMHEESLYGSQNHWNYKNETSKYEKPNWIKEILEIQKENQNTENFIKEIKSNIFQNRIFVFSPKGDVIELPDKATPIDFAYAIHTDIGNKASQVLINEKISTLDHELKNGDLVEIIIEKNKKYPDNQWLNFVKTKHAKDRIKQYSQKGTFDKFKKIFYK
ncbi:MAG: RelA/SpoT family protein [Candidatus Colwellbacteria bacterium]|nr:RelA/SpoT family protein [Candidatus Colwellbacteria bacterium]